MARLIVGQARQYRIVVRGEFGELLATAFENVSIASSGGQTVMVTSRIDESALYGLLDRLRDFAIELVSLQETGPNVNGRSEESLRTDS